MTTHLETLDILSAKVHAYVACLNAGDLKGASALGTDRLLRKTFADPIAAFGVEAFVAAFTDARSEPYPLADQVTVNAVREAGALPDLRIVTLVESTTGSGVRVSSFFVFSLEGDDWLIDEVMALGPTDFGPVLLE